ncbi:hypothetical protein EYF80_013880 [Liparis tanakae]|uniref:Uncharacterized protein n=1 Tax=Liparis tanakae TaxID=230148 RepID=A0A4Z2ID74_9TELE|nr:hypothetical protein EYF80_013880 [Liparis tanakae]
MTENSRVVQLSSSSLGFRFWMRFSAQSVFAPVRLSFFVSGEEEEEQEEEQEATESRGTSSGLACLGGEGGGGTGESLPPSLRSLRLERRSEMSSRHGETMPF